MASAVAPIVDARGRATAFLSVDYQVDVFLDRLRELDVTILEGSAAGALCALVQQQRAAIVFDVALEHERPIALGRRLRCRGPAGVAVLLTLRVLARLPVHRR